MTNLVYEPDVDKRPAFKIPRELQDRIATAIRIGNIDGKVPWYYWAEIARDLGQECARRCWVYPGPSEQDDPPDGGTPVMMRMAA